MVCYWTVFDLFLERFKSFETLRASKINYQGFNFLQAISTVSACSRDRLYINTLCYVLLGEFGRVENSSTWKITQKVKKTLRWGMQSHLNADQQFENNFSPIYKGNLLGRERAVLAVSSYPGTAVKLLLIYTIIRKHKSSMKLQKGTESWNNLFL